MRSSSAFSAAVATTLMGLAVGAPAVAGPATEQLRTSIERVIAVLDDPGLKADAKTRERRSAIREVANETFDFRETARRALGRHWQDLGEPDREEFAALIGDLLEWAYVARIEQYGGERITYATESVEPSGDVATVRTRFTPKSGPDVPVDYRMLKRGDRWRVYDVSVEGISLVANYRSQFNKVIETSSYRELVKRLKARGEEFRGPAAATPRRS